MAQIMDVGFQKPITIKKAIDNIHNRDFLLPAIQRKFVWTSEQIEMLFDSILRGYPINSFMFWEVRSQEIKSNFRFYEFIDEFREFFKENNKNIDTKGVKDFWAVVDGQQRLTSLYLGLHGTYAYKMPRKWWIDCEENIPTRKLYLNLLKEVQQEHDNQKLYDFKFLTQEEINKIKSNKLVHLFHVRDILGINDLDLIYDYLIDNGLLKNKFAKQTLINLYKRIHEDQLINYYLETDQDTDKVLEVFIRTNSGGTPLSFSDLLMSISSANWEKYDARKEIENLIKEINGIGNPSFRINKDFVLKTCLVLFVDNIKFQLRNFDKKNIKVFEDNWVYVRKSIVAGFKIMYRLGFNDTTLRAKNVVIPIIYYLYWKRIADEITNKKFFDQNSGKIHKWVIISLLKSIFSGQSDAVITKIRKVIKDSLDKEDFPYEEIAKAFTGDPVKNYMVEEDFLEGLMNSQYGRNDTFYTLALLYPHLDFYNQDFHVDHLHPAKYFSDLQDNITIISEENKNYFMNPEIWNSIVNLQLLNSVMNESKGAMDLKNWIKENNIDKSSQLIPEDVDLDVKNFREFIEKRKELLKKRIRELVK